jgi:tetratricopeptide (TPR) repeat protein
MTGAFCASWCPVATIVRFEASKKVETTMTAELKTLLYIKPDWVLATDDFPEKWGHLLGKSDELWGEEVEKEDVLNDKSVVLFASEPTRALGIADAVQKALRGEQGSERFPVQMVIDLLPFTGDDQDVLAHLDVNWEEIDHGDIFVSNSVFKAIKRKQDFEVDPSVDTDPHRSFYKVSHWRNSEKTTEPIFRIHTELIKGPHPPCYYCGSKGHLTTGCPSKHLLHGTQGLDKLGYLSFEAINKLFVDYVSSGRQNAILEKEFQTNFDNPYDMAFNGFHEVKRVFQLPFFRNVWNSPDEDWDKVRQAKIEKENNGGIIWMGTDCLRVSNLTQAETFLTTSLESHPEDYRPYCALGFLNIEKDDFLAARHYLIKALNCAETKPQKILMLFLISRLYDLEGYSVEAAENIKEILNISSVCVEAIYQEIILQFRDGKKADALKLLKKLIDLDRRFFVQALIDPALASYSQIVQSGLKDLFNQTKEQAVEIVREARKEYKKAEGLLHAKDRKEVESMWSQIVELSKQDSFFGHSDMIHYGSILIAVARRGIQSKKNELYESLYCLKRRIGKCSVFVKGYPYQSLIRPFCRSLLLIDGKIVETRNMADSDAPEIFKSSLDRPEVISAELDGLESKLARLNAIQLGVLFTTRFVKTSLILQLVIVILAIVLFPVAVHYLNLVLPKYNIAPVENVWNYQQGVLIIGGIGAVLVAFLKTIQGLQKERGHSY